MIITIEGSDGTGKTSLAFHLVQATGWDYFKSNSFPSHNDWIDDWTVMRLLRYADLRKPLILDRAIISGLAYSREHSQNAATIMATSWYRYLAEYGHDVHLVHLEASASARFDRDPEGQIRNISVHPLNEIARTVGKTLPAKHYWPVETTDKTELDAFGSLTELVEIGMKDVHDRCQIR